MTKRKTELKSIEVSFQVRSDRYGGRFPVVWIESRRPLTVYLASALRDSNSPEFTGTPKGLHGVMYGRSRRYIGGGYYVSLAITKKVAYVQESDPLGKMENMVDTIQLSDLEILLKHWCRFVEAVESGKRKRGYTFSILDGVASKPLL